jgi:hypothetical protein
MRGQSWEAGRSIVCIRSQSVAELFADVLGARSLEGLNLTVDSRQKKLVAAGPLPVAVA